MEDFNQLSHQKQGIIFIPDISGFTDFVNSVEVSHSQHIVSELLELIIEELEPHFKISEIEGDAVLSYRFGIEDREDDLIEISQRIFTKFHSHLKYFSKDRVCECGACSTVNHLGLKFIVHSGQFGIHKISNREKLFGKEVILAHRLLKNKIGNSEYIILSGIENFHSRYLIESINEEVEGFGPKDLKFYDLSILKNNIPEPPIRKTLPFPSVRRMAYKYIKTLPFQEIILTITEPEERLKWINNVSKITLKGHKLNRIKSEHECIINGNLIEVTLEELLRNDQEIKILELAALKFPALEMYQLFTVKKINEDTIVLGMGTTLKKGKNYLLNLLKPLIELYFVYQNVNNLKSLASHLQKLSIQKSETPKYSKFYEIEK